MESVDLADYYSGGYFLIRAGRPDWPEPFGEFLPDGNLISLSECICRQQLTVTWGWIPGDRQATLEFGIPQSRLQEFVDWCGVEYQQAMDLPSMFTSVDAAREFIQRFELNTDNLFIIGAGLPKEHHRTWLQDEFKEVGIAKRVNQALPIEGGGVPLGYDVVSYCYSDFGDSWLCSGLEHDMNELYDIRANQHGLIESYQEAKQIYDWIAEDERKGTRAEPYPYYFLLLVSYPLAV